MFDSDPAYSPAKIQRLENARSEYAFDRKSMSTDNARSPVSAKYLLKNFAETEQALMHLRHEAIRRQELRLYNARKAVE